MPLTDEEQELPPYDETQMGEPDPSPSQSPTPLKGTWQDTQEPPDSPNSIRRKGAAKGDGSTVVVVVCPLTGLRATANCPEKEARSYRAGTEPKEFCTFHR
jgi:hypothetical protein